MIERAVEADEIRDVVDKDWPDEVYRHTKIVEGNSVNCGRGTDVAIVLNKEELKMDKGIYKNYAIRYP